VFLSVLEVVLEILLAPIFVWMLLRQINIVLSYWELGRSELLIFSLVYVMFTAISFIAAILACGLLCRQVLGRYRWHLKDWKRNRRHLKKCLGA